MAYRLNESYEVTQGFIKESSIEQYGRMSYLNIRVGMDSASQGYPAYNIPDIQEGISYFNNVMDVDEMKDAIDKKVFIIGSSTEIVILFNPENNLFFSLASKFFPEQYQEAIDDLKLMNEDLKKLSLGDSLLKAIIDKTRSKSDLHLTVQKAINTQLLSELLNFDLSVKEENQAKKNKI